MTCTIGGCRRTYAAKGYCSLHYNRWRRTGDPLTPAKPDRRGMSLEDHVNVVRDMTAGPMACWPFTQAFGTTGYGRFMHDGVMRPAHVWAYELEHGSLATGLVVRHHCDNPPCMNPLHLVSGTHQENMDDKVRRNRQARMPGTQHPGAKLIEAKVEAMRAAKDRGEVTVAQLAAEHEVSRSLIELVLAGKRWKHV